MGRTSGGLYIATAEEVSMRMERQRGGKSKYTFKEGNDSNEALVTGSTCPFWKHDRVFGMCGSVLFMRI